MFNGSNYDRKSQLSGILSEPLNSRALDRIVGMNYSLPAYPSSYLYLAWYPSIRPDIPLFVLISPFTAWYPSFRPDIPLFDLISLFLVWYSFFRPDIHLFGLIPLFSAWYPPIRPDISHVRPEIPIFCLISPLRPNILSSAGYPPIQPDIPF